MPSSLAVQLAQGASLNKSLLVDKSRRKPTESYLFTGKEADQHDYEAIHALACNGLLQLKSLDPSLAHFQSVLFSDATKRMDRTLQTAEVNGDLDKKISAFLKKLGPYLMESPTAKVLEWLVRRFRIHEFNINAVFALFLPYHESPHFTKMLSILHIQQQSLWDFLLPYKAAARNIPRMALVKEMLHNTELSRFIVDLLPTSIKEGASHRTLIIFTAATLHDFILHSKELDEGTVAFVYPALLQSLLTKQKRVPSKDAILGSYVLLSALSQKCHLSAQALQAIITAMANSAHLVTTKQFVTSVISVCEPQDELDAFSGPLADTILSLQSVHHELRKAATWQGVEKLLHPLLPSVVERIDQPQALQLLESLLTASNTPSVVIRHTTSLLFNVVFTRPAGEDSLTHQRLLSAVQQRHPSPFQLAVDDAISENPDSRQTLESLVISLTVGPSSNNRLDTKSKTPAQDKAKKGLEKNDHLVASASANKHVRCIAVRDLLHTLSENSTNMEPAELESVHSALMMRLNDSSLEVIQALYANPPDLLPVISANAETYVKTLAILFRDTRVSEDIVLAHLSFTAKYLAPSRPSLNTDVFHNVFFPFLLFCKQRQKFVRSVWNILALREIEEGLGMYELFGGCVDTLRWEEDKGRQDGTAGNSQESIFMATANLAIAAKIAENIFASNDFHAHYEQIITKLRDHRPHTRNLAYMILRALLVQLSGEQQINAALDVLEAMEIKSLEKVGSFMGKDENLQDFLEDKKLSLNVVVNPSSPKTLHWLQTSLLALFPIMSRPNGVRLNWFVPSRPDDAGKTDWSGPVDTRGDRYVWLMRCVYKLANDSSTLSVLSTRLMQALFMTLREDALAFLAGLWTSLTDSSDDNWLRLIALSHSVALLKAYQERMVSHAIDMQTILPAFIVALSSANSSVRKCAGECMSLMSKLSKAKKVSSVYAFDSIYGKYSDNLQYLEWDDFGMYVQALDEESDHLVNDPEFVEIFHKEHLGREKNDSKKTREAKQRVLCYLLSHANAVTLPHAKLDILKAVRNVTYDVKAQFLLPTIRFLVSETASGAPAKAFGPLLVNYEVLVISALNVSAQKGLNNDTNGMWQLFLACIRHYFVQGPTTVCAVLSDAIIGGISSKLSFERKVQLCEVLIDISINDGDAYQQCKAVLAELLSEVQLTIQLLASVRSIIPDSASHGKKRARLDSSTHDNVVVNAFAQLSIFAETIASLDLPGSLDLIASILETLSNVVHSDAPANVDIAYIEQLLMSAVEGVAVKVSEPSNVSPSAVRVDILVELVRVTGNPQTSHQALLLIGSLARLCPDSIFHNIMPVFTFMGSSVLHRDDTYSFRVVQKTIDSIVPVMVSSLKRGHSGTLELYIASRDYLRVFTDAANHIPRHRRTSLFIHVADVFGSEDFLAPICMLLVDKVASRVVRQVFSEAKTTLHLPIAVIQHYPIHLHLTVLIEILRESRRLLSCVDDVNAQQNTFLQFLSDEEDSHIINLKRKIGALVTFVGCSVSSGESLRPSGPSEDGALSVILSLLTEISVSSTSAPLVGKAGFDEVSKVGQLASKEVLRIMAAAQFLRSVQTMLQSEDTKIQRGALDLLSERLPGITEAVRSELRVTMSDIITHIGGILSLAVADGLVAAAYNALGTTAATCNAGEEDALTTVLPTIMRAIHERINISNALKALNSLIPKLGPRIIPFFHSVVDESISLLHETQDGESASSVNEDVVNLLDSLLVSIPAFWSNAELLKIVKYLVESRVSPQRRPAVVGFMRRLSKRAPPKALLPALFSAWPLTVLPSEDHCLRYFSLLKRSIHTAPRALVLEHARQTFAIFLAAFDLQVVPQITPGEGEAEIIGAFLELTVKLNEASFRPLIRRLHDWAFPSTDTSSAKKTTFCHIYDSLLDYFKALMTPYMSFIFQALLDVLDDFTRSSSSHEPELWMCTMQVIAKSLDVDDGAFWRDDKLRLMAGIAVNQVETATKLNVSEGKSVVHACLASMVEITNDDATLKSLNLGILMHTRSEDARLRVFALTCTEKLWRAHGGKLLGLVAETSTFIAECAEDENDTVVKESHKLKDAVETIAGNLSGL